MAIDSKPRAVVRAITQLAPRPIWVCCRLMRGSCSAATPVMIPLSPRWTRTSSAFQAALNPDVYAFEIAAPALIDVVVVPRGGRFHQAVDGGPELLNDAFSSSDLAFSVLSAHATLLADANAQPAGGVEMTRNLFLPAGQYFLQIAGSREVAQLYELQISLQPAPVPEPPTFTAATFVFAMFCCAIARRQRFC